MWYIYNMYNTSVNILTYIKYYLLGTKLVILQTEVYNVNDIQLHILV